MLVIKVLVIKLAKNTTENNQGSVKAIVVVHNDNKDNHQYLLENKKWVKLNKLPDSVGKLYQIH